MNLRLLISALLLAAASPPFAADTNILKNSRTGPVILGAEVSWAPEDEADGAEDFDHGVKKDIFEILKEYKFNYIRLRLFVNPSSTNGYARRRAEAFCDLEHVKPFRVSGDRWIGAKVGIIATARSMDTKPGYADFDWFHVTKTIP